jgi:hypothetical protein
MESKFKVGDVVRRIGVNKTDRVTGLPGMREYDNKGFLDASKGMQLENDIWSYQEYWELVSRGSKVFNAPKFILQYELDSDPFELFVTEKELRSRIAELAARSDLKRESIKVYDIKRVRSVKLGVKISFKGV